MKAKVVNLHSPLLLREESVRNQSGSSRGINLTSRRRKKTKSTNRLFKQYYCILCCYKKLWPSAALGTPVKSNTISNQGRQQVLAWGTETVLASFVDSQRQSANQGRDYVSRCCLLQCPSAPPNRKTEQTKLDLTNVE
jgi:hypothetical protein